MKYRITEVTPPNNSDVYYEVEATIPSQYPSAWSGGSESLDWVFQAKFNTISACQQYIQNQAQPKRKVISEIEV